MSRIIEAFTRSHCDVTAIDELIQFLVIITIILAMTFVIYLFCKMFL